MLPHGGYCRAENAKMRRASFSLKLNSLQNHGLTNLQNHGLNDMCVFLPMVLQILQDYASLSSLQDYASHIL